MRQFRRPTPTLSSLTALRALAGVLVAAAVLSAPIQITAAQAPEAPRAGRAAQPAPPPAAPAAAAPQLYETDRRSAEQTRDRLREVIEQYSPSLFEVFRHDPSLLLNDSYLASYPGLANFLKQHP
ncbi:MAG: hypothetical protein ABW360_02855, partial [Phenylobacterium sp.]